MKSINQIIFCLEYNLTILRIILRPTTHNNNKKIIYKL